MKATAHLVSAGVLALAAGTVLAGPAAAHSPDNYQHRAVFVQTDNPAGNGIVVYDRDGNGRLTKAGMYPTGGRGGVLGGSVVDHLASQGAVTYDRQHNLLYVVNAGSNTVTVFAVNGDRLRRLQVIGSGGTFPVSVTVKGNAVYVLNARNGGSVQGYLRLGDRLLPVPFWHRALGLHSSATPEFGQTPGQIAFTPDGSKLIVTTKGTGSSIEVFSVDRLGGLSSRPVVNADSDSSPFAVTFDAHGHLAVAESGTNTVTTFRVNRDGTVSRLARAQTGQQGTCWVVADGNNLYASNAASGSLTGLHSGGGGDLTALGNTPTDGGTVDATVTPDGRYLYAETGAAGVLDEFRINPDGSLTAIGSVTVPSAVGAEGIAAS